MIYQQAEAFLAEQTSAYAGSLAHAKRVALTRHDVKNMQLTPLVAFFAHTSQAQEEAN